MENLTNNEFMSIIFLGWVLSMLYDIILSIINYFNEKAWLVNDYEKIIATYLNTYVTVDNKEKKLIAQAKEKVEKRNERRKKIKSLFNRGKK